MNYPFLTSKERDIETGLDYFGARYYANVQGRFTSPDEPLLDQSQRNPASWNLYSFVRNNPLRFIDPSGNQTQPICPDCPDGPPLTPEEIEQWNRQVDEGDVDIWTTDTNFCGSCGPAGMVWDNGDPMRGRELPGTYRWDLYAGTWVRRTWSDRLWQFGKDAGMADPTFWVGGAVSRGGRGFIFGARVGMGAVGLVKTSELLITHGLTKSKRAFQALKAEISANGIKESIKYVELNGEKYVVDGHHRLRAARELRISEVPAEKVSLPYGEYKTVDDLLYSDF